MHDLSEQAQSVRMDIIYGFDDIKCHECGEIQELTFAIPVGMVANTNLMEYRLIETLVCPKCGHLANYIYENLGE